MMKIGDRVRKRDNPEERGVLVTMPRADGEVVVCWGSKHSISGRTNTVNVEQLEKLEVIDDA